MATGQQDTIAMMTEARLREPKSTVGVYELPCGFVDAAGVLHTEVQLREVTGRDEDMLANEKIPNAKKMNLLLASCVVRIGTITDKQVIASVLPEMLIGDRVFLVLAIRRVSIGDDYPYTDTCPSCEKESLMSIDLSQLDIIPMADRTKRVFDARLPSVAAIREWANHGEDVPEPEKSNPTGRTIRFKQLVGKDEERSSKATSGAEAISTLLALRILMLDEKPPTIEDLQSMGMAERMYIRDVVFRAGDGGVDTSLDVTCPQCQHEFKRELDINQVGFFFPSVARKNSKTRSST